MVWGLVRVSIFATAFLIGMMLADPSGTVPVAASSQPASIPQSDGGAGSSVVVACESGAVTVKQLTDRGRFQFDCIESETAVRRDQRPSSEKIPEIRYLRYQVY